MSYNDHGVELDYSQHNNISNNEFKEHKGYAVYIKGPNQNIISKDNVFINNGGDIKEKTMPLKTPGFEFSLVLIVIISLLGIILLCKNKYQN